MSSELLKDFCPDKGAVLMHRAYKGSLPNRFGIIKKLLTGEKLSGFVFCCFFVCPVLFLFASRTFLACFLPQLCCSSVSAFAVLSVLSENLLQSVFLSWSYTI